MMPINHKPKEQQFSVVGEEQRVCPLQHGPPSSGCSSQPPSLFLSALDKLGLGVKAYFLSKRLFKTVPQDLKAPIKWCSTVPRTEGDGFCFYQLPLNIKHLIPYLFIICCHQDKKLMYSWGKSTFFKIAKTICHHQKEIKVSFGKLWGGGHTSFTNLQLLYLFHSND